MTTLREEIQIVNRLFEILPFDGIEGGALSYSKRERGMVLQGPIPGDIPDNVLSAQEQLDLNKIRRIKEIEIPEKTIGIRWSDKFACITLGERVEV